MWLAFGLVLVWQLRALRFCGELVWCVGLRAGGFVLVVGLCV